ncbi:hypothetical protein TRFO_02241 [Tritrichomonas foetus]|uniref:Bromo domain-containing protein n=1 Tax=Tritrichomonas foetus TaxID=1144522 RepID=A0A1J4JAJ3_9EUKA|nr:hypothetical protein TRFO_02241 [Tritrichomonas foetus]|eukprot:OHS95255.1 hypothetical protein TRFO_02241 [Tritrichomonas foetus]
MVENVTWEIQKDLCNQIVDELLQYPIAQVYRVPFSCRYPSNNNPDNYPPQKQSLDVIKERSNDGTYASAKDWHRDMKLFFMAILHKSTKDPLLRLIAREFNRKYEKKMKRFELFQEKKWTEKCNILRKKIDELILNSPETIKPHFPLTMTMKPEEMKIASYDLEFIIRCSRKISKPSDILALSNILEEDCPNISTCGTDVQIDLRALKKQTIFVLLDFFKKRFPEEEIRPKIMFPIPIQ